jgi:hypothetical protein
MAKRKPLKGDAPGTPYRARLTPYFEVCTRVEVWRTAGDVELHDGWHRGGMERAREIMHGVIDADEAAIRRASTHPLDKPRPLVQ